MKSNTAHSSAIILAAGRGSRMKAKSKNKVAFKLHGEPMISHTVKHLNQAGITNIVAVVGFQSESVKQALGERVSYITQVEQMGTGDAIKTAVPLVHSDTQTVLTVYGDDSAFYPPELFTQMIDRKVETKADVLFLTIHKD